MFCPVVNFQPINELVYAITCVVERKTQRFRPFFGTAIIPTATSAHQINFVDHSCRFWQLGNDTPNQRAYGRQRPDFDGTDGKIAVPSPSLIFKLRKAQRVRGG
jgi:hypothetical protein